MRLTPLDIHNCKILRPKICLTREDWLDENYCLLLKGHEGDCEYQKNPLGLKLYEKSLD